MRMAAFHYSVYCVALCLMLTVAKQQQQYLFRQRAGTPEEPEEQSPSKLATILRATKENKQKKEKLRYKNLDKPVSTMSGSLYTYQIITRTVAYA